MPYSDHSDDSDDFHNNSSYFSRHIDSVLISLIIISFFSFVGLLIVHFAPVAAIWTLAIGATITTSIHLTHVLRDYVIKPIKIIIKKLKKLKKLKKQQQEELNQQLEKLNQQEKQLEKSKRFIDPKRSTEEDPTDINTKQYQKLNTLRRRLYRDADKQKKINLGDANSRKILYFTLQELMGRRLIQDDILYKNYYRTINDNSAKCNMIAENWKKLEYQNPISRDGIHPDTKEYVAYDVSENKNLKEALKIVDAIDGRKFDGSMMTKDEQNTALNNALKKLVPEDAKEEFLSVFQTEMKYSAQAKDGKFPEYDKDIENYSYIHEARKFTKKETKRESYIENLKRKSEILLTQNKK